MKVTINGITQERIEELEQQERRYYEEIKSACIVVGIGYLVFVCLAGILHFVAGVPVDFGAASFINAFKVG
jgi:hypothetical protein